MDLRSKKGLYKTKQDKTLYYFYVVENTDYELIGHYIVVDKKEVLYRLNRELTMRDLRDKTSVWHSMKECDNYKDVITSLFEKEVLV